MRKHGIELRFSAEGATAAEIELAEAAAWAVFEDAGVDPWAAAAADFKLEGAMEFDLYGGIKALTDDECELSSLWQTAIKQAAVAYFGTEDYGLDPRNKFDFELVPSSSVSGRFRAV